MLMNLGAGQWVMKSTKLNIITDTGKKKKNEKQLERVMYPQESMDALLTPCLFV